jgi:hypothetical protein
LPIAASKSEAATNHDPAQAGIPRLFTFDSTQEPNALARRLADSIDRLRKEVEQVELWASAVSGFTQPVPDYEPDTTSVAHYLKPGRPARKRRRRRAANQNDWRDAKLTSR